MGALKASVLSVGTFRSENKPIFALSESKGCANPCTPSGWCAIPCTLTGWGATRAGEARAENLAFQTTPGLFV